MDWLRPTREMMEGRYAGRSDRQSEIDNLNWELDSVNEELAEATELLRRVLTQMEDNCQHDDLKFEIEDFLKEK